MKNIKLFTNKSTASIDLNIQFVCEECKNTQFEFLIIKDETVHNNTLDSPFGEEGQGVLTVVCKSCGYSYTFNLNIDNVEEESIFDK